MALFALVWQRLPEKPVGQVHLPSEHVPPFWQMTLLQLVLVQDEKMTIPEIVAIIMAVITVSLVFFIV